MNALNAFSSVNFGQEDAIAGLCDSPEERNVLAETVLKSYKELSGDKMDTTANCPLRGFAVGLLKTKAGVTKEQVSGLTNGQLSDYVKELCKSGDAQAVKDDIAYTTGIKDAPVKDNKVEPVKGNKDDGFRSNAREILVGQVKVPDDDFVRLTNDEISNFLETLRDTKDPSAVKDAIAMTVEDRAVKG